MRIWYNSSCLQFDDRTSIEWSLMGNGKVTWQPLNPFTLVSDRARISPYIINTISSRQVMRNKGKYQPGNYKLIQYQILQSNIIRMIWQIVMRITNEIMNGSQMVNKWFSIKYLSCSLRRKLNSLIMMWLLLNDQKLMLRLWKISQKKMRRVRMKLPKDTQLWNAKEASKNHQEPQGDAHGEHFIKSLD